MMTIESNVNKQSFIGDGATRSFVFQEDVLVEDGIGVLLFNDTSKETQYLVRDVDYQVFLVGRVCTILLLAVTPTPAAGTRLIMYRTEPAEQTLDYVIGGNFPANSTENALDKIILGMQSLHEQVKRSVKLPEALLNKDADGFFDGKTEFPQENSYLAWDEDLKVVRFVADTGGMQGPQGDGGASSGNGGIVQILVPAIYSVGDIVSVIPVGDVPTVVDPITESEDPFFLATVMSIGDGLSGSIVVPFHIAESQHSVGEVCDDIILNGVNIGVVVGENKHVLTKLFDAGSWPLRDDWELLRKFTRPQDFQPTISFSLNGEYPEDLQLANDIDGYVDGLVTPSLYRVDIYAYTDGGTGGLGYLVGSAPLTANGSWVVSCNFAGGGVVRAVLVEIVGDVFVKDTYAERGTVRSYNVPREDYLFTFLGDRTFVYDQALYLIAASARDEQEAIKAFRIIQRMQYAGTPALGSRNGHFSFSYFEHSYDETGLHGTMAGGLIATEYGNANVRSGASFWVLMSLLYFTEKFPISPSAPLARIIAIKGIDALILNQYEAGAGAGYQQYAFTGGSGAYLAATGLITFTAVPVIGEWILINDAKGNSISFGFGGGGDITVSLGSTIDECRDLLLTAINSHILLEVTATANGVDAVDLIYTDIYVTGLPIGGTSASTTSVGFTGGGYNASYVIPWVSTEHNIDAWWVLKMAVDQGLNTIDTIHDYTDILSNLQTKLLAEATPAIKGFWIEADGRCIQGITNDSNFDTAHALDVASWYASAVWAMGTTESKARAIQALPFVEAYRVNDPSNLAISGYRAYLATYGYPLTVESVWLEGTFGVILARILLGGRSSAKSDYIAALVAVTPDGYPYTTIDVTPYEMKSWSSVASTAWACIVQKPSGFWGANNQ